MPAMTKVGLLALADSKPTRVDMPDGQHVFVRVMEGFERDEFERLLSGDKMASMRTWLTVHCACDANGKRLFKDSDFPDVGKIVSTALDPIWTGAFKANKLGVKDVEDLLGNSDGSPSDDSGSA